DDAVLRGVRMVQRRRQVYISRAPMAVGPHTLHIDAGLLDALRDVAAHTGWPLRDLIERAIRRETGYLNRRGCRARDNSWVGMRRLARGAFLPIGREPSRLRWWEPPGGQRPAGRWGRGADVRHTFVIDDTVVTELKRCAAARGWPMRL